MRESLHIFILCICCVTFGYNHELESLDNGRTNRKLWILELKDTENNIPEENTVHLKVYYEALCPASIRFMTSQLKPVVQKLGTRVAVNLVPYGHARTRLMRGRYSFRCQHGPAECYGNMLQACAIDALQNSTEAILFNACAIGYAVDTYRFEDSYSGILNWCSYKVNLPLNGIWECMNTYRSTTLMKNYGSDTRAVKPEFVPYIVMDGSSHNQDELGSNLMSMVCNKLQPAPSVCRR